MDSWGPSGHESGAFAGSEVRLAYVLRRLDDHAVVDAVHRIEPEIWLKQSAAIKLGEQTGRDLLFGYANLEGLGAILNYDEKPWAEEATAPPCSRPRTGVSILLRAVSGIVDAL
jgi:hypothetical protein